MTSTSASNDADLPRELPGREADEALGMDDPALLALRAKITGHLDATQGAFAARPLWDRMAPLAVAVVCALGAVAWGGATGGMTFSAVGGLLASLIALTAVALAPQRPGHAEWCARAALAVACAALATEIGLAWLSPPTEGGTDVQCASAISVLALPPLAMATWFLARSQMPARMFHVAAIACAAFLASGAAVWAECPGTHMGHVMRSHIVAPLVVAVLLALLSRRATRGPKLPS
jgi:hypothetical protein